MREQGGRLSAEAHDRQREHEGSGPKAGQGLN